MNSVVPGPDDDAMPIDPLAKLAGRVAELERVVGDRGEGLIKDSLEALGADRELRVEQLTNRERLEGVARDVSDLRFTVGLGLAIQVTTVLGVGALALHAWGPTLTRWLGSLLP